MDQALADDFVGSDTNEVARFSEETLKRVIREYAEPA